MENKKTKLTISGSPKKNLKNFESTKSLGKKTVKINNQINKPVNKSNYNSNLNDKKNIQYNFIDTVDLWMSNSSGQNK